MYVSVRTLYSAVVASAVKDCTGWLDLLGEYHRHSGEKYDQVRLETMDFRFNDALYKLNNDGELDVVHLEFGEHAVRVTYAPEVLAALRSYQEQIKERLTMPVVLDPADHQEFLEWLARDFPGEMPK